MINQKNKGNEEKREEKNKESSLFQPVCCTVSQRPGSFHHRTGCETITTREDGSKSASECCIDWFYMFIEIFTRD
jgi:hypothetical protein